MLLDYKDKLIRYSQENHNEFVGKVSQKLGFRASSSLIQDLKDFIVNIPDMLEKIRIYNNDTNVPENKRNNKAFVQSYLFHPEDIIPENKHGLFGFLDDAYIISFIYLEILKSKHRYCPEINKLKKWISATELVLPEETKTARKIVKKLFERKIRSFYESKKLILNLT